MLTSTLGVSTAAEGFSQAPWPCQEETLGALRGGGGQEGSAGAFVVPSMDRGSCGCRVARSECGAVQRRESGTRLEKAAATHAHYGIGHEMRRERLKG